MTQFFAQHYDLAATGFYFETAEQYREKITRIRNDYGQPVEEFAIQFIDGERIDAAFAHAWGLSQANILRFIEVIDEWEEWEKIFFILGVGECGMAFDLMSDEPGHLDIQIHYVRNMRELAEEFVAEGLFGPVPEAFRFYIDYDAIARDLAVDYAATDIAGDSIIYRCG